MRSKKLEVASATTGAGAAITMGALGVAFSNVGLAEPPPPAPPGPVTTSEITTGATETETVVPEAPESPVAVPPITTTPSFVGAPGEKH